jgi:hypothetical protein
MSLVRCVLLSFHSTLAFLTPQIHQRRYSILYASERDELLQLYRTVAELDPEWYQEFVCNILQDDLLANENVSAMKNANGDDSNSILKFESDRRDQPRALVSATPTAKDEIIVDEVDDAAGVELARNDNEQQETETASDRILEVDHDDSPLGRSFVSDMYFKDKYDEGYLELTPDMVKARNEVLVLSQGENDSMVESAVQELKVEPTNDALQEIDKSKDIQVAENAPDDTASSRPSIVVYRDLYSGALLMAPLKNLTRLGYTSEEVSFLQPDALSLILEDEIAKPRRGVPQQWKVSPSQKRVLQDDVRIVTKYNAKQILDGSKMRKLPQGTLQDEEIIETRPLSRPRGDENQRRQRSTIHQDAETRQGVRKTDERKRSSTTYARSTLSKARGDPPPPVNPIWLDINKFRDLLRREAELRVQILGDDWEETVKKESKWRLDLYKEWLWSLSEGVGDPIVESRVPRSQINAQREKQNLNAPLSRGGANAKARPKRRVLDPREQTETFTQSKWEKSL